MKNPSAEVRFGSETAVQRYLSATLAMLVLLLSMASVSPALHDWLAAKGAQCASNCSDAHDSSNAPESDAAHVCAVELFGLGADAPSVLVTAAIHLIEVERLSLQSTLIWSQESLRSSSARAPPIESVITA